MGIIKTIAAVLMGWIFGTYMMLAMPVLILFGCKYDVNINRSEKTLFEFINK